MSRNASFVSLLALPLLAIGSGCVEPEKARLPQAVSLADSLRFVQLSVNGNVVVLEIARSGATDASGRPAATARAGVNDPIDFPEYATFTKDASGKLTWIKDQSKLGVNLVEPKCADTGCTTLSVALTVPGSTKLADRADLFVTRVADLACAGEIRETNGAETALRATFPEATLATTVANGESTGRWSIYAKTAFVDSETGYRTRLFLRSFLGLPAELWHDEIDFAVRDDGRADYLQTAVRTFDVETFKVSGASATLFASDAEDRRVAIGCTAAKAIPVPVKPAEADAPATPAEESSTTP